MKLECACRFCGPGAGEGSMRAHSRDDPAQEDGWASTSSCWYEKLAISQPQSILLMHDTSWLCITSGSFEQNELPCTLHL